MWKRLRDARIQVSELFHHVRLLRDKAEEHDELLRHIAERIEHNRRLLDRLLGEKREFERAVALIEQSRPAQKFASFPPEELWQGRPRLIPDAGPVERYFDCSRLCRQTDFETPMFCYWAEKLGLALSYARKTWEFVYICQGLYERGALVPGARGLGFGVGEESLPAYLASLGCQILGTDLPGEQSQAAGWTATSQHAGGKETLRRPGICPDPLFDKNVSFLACDMNAIPPTLQDFDFCWSACALEHLGSIEQGLQFILNSVECLKPGGWAVHTTEYNLDSNDETVEHAGTVLFRRRDFEDLARRLADKGCAIAPFDFDPGSGALDRYVDLPPYRPEPHLKLALEGFAATSIGLIIHKAA